MSDIAEALNYVTRLGKVLEQAETVLRTAQDEERNAAEGTTRAVEAEKRLKGAEGAIRDANSLWVGMEKNWQRKIDDLKASYASMNAGFEANHKDRMAVIKATESKAEAEVDAKVAVQTAELDEISVALDEANQALINAKSDLASIELARKALLAKLT